MGPRPHPDWASCKHWMEQDGPSLPSGPEGQDKGRGREEAKQELIRALNGVLTPEVIAEKFGLPVNYVLDVLGDMKP